jgi:hypothetical protein
MCNLYRFRDAAPFFLELFHALHAQQSARKIQPYLGYTGAPCQSFLSCRVVLPIFLVRRNTGSLGPFYNLQAIILLLV